MVCRAHVVTCGNGAISSPEVMMIQGNRVSIMSMSGHLHVKQGSVMKGGKLALQMSLQEISKHMLANGFMRNDFTVKNACQELEPIDVRDVSRHARISCWQAHT